MRSFAGSRQDSLPVPGLLLDPRPYGLNLLILAALILSQIMAAARISTFQAAFFQPASVWRDKPILGYFVFTGSLGDKLAQQAGLTVVQFMDVTDIAARQRELLRQLEEESWPIVLDPDSTLEAKRQRIAEMRYNERVKEIVHLSQRQLISALGPYPYLHLVRWVEHEWERERELHGTTAATPALRTYRVYATRYDSNGAYTVALPDKCLKFANGGNHVCDEDGYTAGAGYTVFISYQSGTAAVVGESGPWNVDDNYWATTSDPTPRRMFADLPLGMPEAQAAYFDGYNGGSDQFGRAVTAPFGIDLAREVSIDIGLQPGKNDWIDVSFMWTEGWDGSSGSTSTDPQNTNIPQPTIIPIELAPANPDGSVIHEVREGQTLWNIAAAYQVDLAEILRLNNLADGALIYPGQKLLVKPASQTITPSPLASVSEPSRTPVASHPPTPRKTPTPIAATQIARVGGSPPAPTPEPAQPERLDASQATKPAVDPLLTGIIASGAIGALLFFYGHLSRMRR